MTRLEFNNQVLQLSTRLYVAAFRFLRVKEEAEDAVQETFLRLWNRREELGKYQSIEALAVTTIRNHCIDLLRKKRIRLTENTDDRHDIQGSEIPPDMILERKETDEILNRIIGNLPRDYREIITMKEIDGLTYEEIAAVTGQNINTLRVSLSRARKIIRHEFKRYIYEYSGNQQAAGKVL